MMDNAVPADRPPRVQAAVPPRHTPEHDAGAHDAGAHEVTRLLQAWGAGDPGALDQLFPSVYHELRRQARRYMDREHEGHTLQTTALVHEAYLRLVDQRSARWESRTQFFAVAAQVMRRVLVDHARARGAARRGGAAVGVALDEATAAAPEPAEDVVALDEALTRLATFDPRQARVVELRYFAGLGIAEAAEVLGVSRATADRDWAMARAWLRRELRSA
jgi:RNA polymerase sigma factor (TIGR02999 family)